MYAWVYVCMCVCMYVLYADTRVCIHLCVYACMYIYACVHTCMYICNFQVGLWAVWGDCPSWEKELSGGNCPGELSMGKCPCSFHIKHIAVFLLCGFFCEFPDNFFSKTSCCIVRICVIYLLYGLVHEFWDTTFPLPNIFDKSTPVSRPKYSALANSHVVL